MDRFEKDAPHFLDIKISKYIKIFALGQTAYIKNPHTGQYVNFEIHALWNCKIGWIRSLVKRVKQMRSADLLPAKIHNIKTILRWNGISKSMRNTMIKLNLSKPSRQKQ